MAREYGACGASASLYRCLPVAASQSVMAGGSRLCQRRPPVGYGFATSQRAHFQVMFGNHVDWTCKHPQLEETADTAFGVLISQVQACQAARLIRSGDPLVPALFAWSMVHGLSELIANGQFNALELSVPPVEQLMGMMNLMLIEGARPRE